MSETEFFSASRRNPRAGLSESEVAAVARLLQDTRDRARRHEAALRDNGRLAVKRALNAATRKFFAGANPDYDALAEQVAGEVAPGVTALKLAGGTFETIDEAVELTRHDRLLDWVAEMPSYVEIRDWLRWVSKIRLGPRLTDDPPFARDFWWGETHSFGGGPGLFSDINADPCRIWGHIDYDSDPLLGGSIGVAKFFFLTPDRFPVRGGTSFEIRPRARIGGWASGWTGFYHPIWGADDKWSKCWQNLRVTASLSTGEMLDDSMLNFNLFFLEDASPVGQGNASLFMGWEPVLRVRADLTDLRTRGVSIILKAELRYDYQLKGESDLWLRNRHGSNADSVAGFDNAVTFRVFPGSLLSV